MLVASGRKEVSSSNAHAAVTASPLWMGRPDRADQRVQNLKAALARGDHSTLAQVAWQELWEMHSLFHTSPQPFTYWLPLSLEILKWLKPWVDEGFSQAPVVTMDAGPNVHLLVPDSRADEWKARIAERFPGLEVLVDQAGVGATFL
jgi:diphosphomevalonate decarboxylase